MVAKSGWISAVAGCALLPGLRSFEVFEVFVVQKRVTIYVVMYSNRGRTIGLKQP